MTSSASGRRALITGITGQDGSYLAEALLERGYQVFGLVRRLSIPNTRNIQSLLPRIHLLDGDLHDQASIDAAMRASEPDEIYNLAAQSFVGASFTQPVVTGEVTGIGALRVFEAMRTRAEDARLYQASSSEMFGAVEGSPQDEHTPFRPRSPYGFAKLYAYWASVNYRESYGLFIANGILFNHESPRRGLEFVTRKISDGVARIHLGLARSIRLGSLDPRRDWGYAPEYVDLMTRILAAGRPSDFVGATGTTHSVREFVAAAFATVGIERWEAHVETDPRYIRPAEVEHLCGNAGRARDELGWRPSMPFEELVRVMVRADIDELRTHSEPALAARDVRPSEPSRRMPRARSSRPAAIPARRGARGPRARASRAG